MGNPFPPVDNPFVPKLCWYTYTEPDWPENVVKQFVFFAVKDLLAGQNAYMYPDFEFDFFGRCEFVRLPVATQAFPAGTCVWQAGWQWGTQYYKLEILLGVENTRIAGYAWGGDVFFYYQGPTLLTGEYPNQLTEPPFVLAKGGSIIVTF